VRLRPARPADAAAITGLLDQLGYPGTARFLARRIGELAADPDEELVVAEREGAVVAVLCGCIWCRSWRWRAMARGCERLEVHCAQQREGAQRFYGRHGYVESPRCRVRRLSDAAPP
jgi:hypothetical protein